MQSISILIGVTLLIVTPGIAETLIPAVDSDVVLESAVDAVVSAPQDVVNRVGDAVKYVGDETGIAVRGAAAILEDDPREETKNAALRELGSAWDSSNDIIYRAFKIAPNVGESLKVAGLAIGDGQTIDVSGFFGGMDFPEKTSAYYRPEFEYLFVRQTLGNVLVIEDILAELHNANRELLGFQVEIETKFIEVNQETMNELGFGWRFNGKDGGAASLVDDLVLPDGQDLFASGLRTASTALSGGSDAGLMLVSKTAGSLNWQMMISALEQADDADVLCAPRVVTRDGNTAIIEVGDEQMLPRAFDVNNGDTSPYVEHTDWELDLLGVRLEVTPELLEGDMIRLEILPRIWELSGYDSYKVLVESVCTHTDVGDRPAVEASMPYLRVREMETVMTVDDGSTVGMGGMLYDKQETFRDKVPVLGSIPYVGRLFRSEGERSVKRNLMIFVKAGQVDVNGRTTAETALNF